MFDVSFAVLSMQVLDSVGFFLCGKRFENVADVVGKFVAAMVRLIIAVKLCVMAMGGCVVARVMVVVGADLVWL